MLHRMMPPHRLRNIRNAEVFFCDVGHGEGQDKAENRETACVGIFAVEEFEKPVNGDPENSCACENSRVL